MRAQVTAVLPNTTKPSIEIICNPLEPIFVALRRPTKHYKKVGKEARAKLLRCIQNGWSIINVAKKFNINYSTAKSIVQNHKKRGELTGKREDRASETDECECSRLQC